MKKKDAKRKKTGRRKTRSKLGIFYDNLLLNAEMPVMVTDKKGVVVFTNIKYLEVSEYSSRSLKGKNWAETLVPEPEREDVQRICSEIKKSRTCCYHLETPILTRKGRRRHVYWMIVPLADEKKTLFMFIGRVKHHPPKQGVKIHYLTAEKLQITYAQVIKTLFDTSRIIEPDVAEHALKVTLIALALGEKIKLSRKKMEKLRIATLLHDFGKLAIRANILYKKGRLKRTEYDEIKKHPTHGTQMVRPVYFLRDIIPIMESHHENYDGGGYPRGIKGREIPVESRILAIADMYEALTADRPYRRAFTKRQAIAIMEKEKGRKLDPDLTDIFLKMLEKNKYNDHGEHD